MEVGVILPLMLTRQFQDYSYRRMKAEPTVGGGERVNIINQTKF